ncbi:UNVERIFIED_CONTAM: putative transcriptional regulator RABBIT EARS [Sesamum radiatum]|uniref:Transcriptional regulator RABBIT EARS n=1 Tax=Sesamum radiatum TaxID=300843 RepID=A0AAW2WBC8_SESRA
MEHKYQESLMNSCEEGEQTDQNKDDVGVGIGCLYECVFCKRGFNTAQALGGHMNVHRRDRFSSNKPPTSTHPINKQQQDHGPHHHLVYHDDHQPNSSLSAYFPPSSSSTTVLIRPAYRRYFPDDQQYCNDDDDQKQPENNLAVSDHSGYGRRVLDEKRQVVVSQEQELDLELRLG